jgi:hypothetical protein
MSLYQLVAAARNEELSHAHLAPPFLIRDRCAAMVDAR